MKIYPKSDGKIPVSWFIRQTLYRKRWCASFSARLADRRDMHRIVMHVTNICDAMKKT